MQPLKEADPELYALLAKEKERQVDCIELIASENFVSTAVQECLGSCLTNKYSEGSVGARYYGGMEFVDQIEALCIQRAKEAFGLDPEEWHVNVQPHSGSPANFAVLMALLQPHDRFMGLGLNDGGHLTHGAYTPSRRISATSLFYESLPYGLDPKTGLIDYDDLEKVATVFRPKMIICGHSAYPRLLDYKRFREIADKVGAILWCDMAHFSGFVAAGIFESPFKYCDVVTTTTHKTLRCQMLLLRLFVGALVTCTPEWRAFSRCVLENCKVLARELQNHGLQLVTGGTDNHLLLLDLKPQGLTGAKLQLICDMANITLNKNSIAGDSSGIPTGVRIGTPAMTTRGFGAEEFKLVADFIREAVDICCEIQEKSGKKLAEFRKHVSPSHPRISNLRDRVKALARSFPMPGRPDI
ncbi:Serine hydroxymethyltransferase, related [Eimeria tenella]|uniref:glycine hydroxymethyltransferase n=1 Tax=Eimeria tenella TaxID=5802 RepID=U6KPB2_EIMTE|nr:Serine hydroxymethyltransferase, related [Eimeria tenella]CDJ38127.1 Serine hydroxymethyltransferase, related [Eimeria tenella]|eukprot:XP_013228965.1 Serine hydroxymethyltransferase, related [Eimeria tenella]